MDFYELDSHLRQLTPHQSKLLEVVYNAGPKWVTRIEIARRIGKRRLTPYDMILLKDLSDRGLMMMSTKPTTGFGADFAYIYQVGEEVAVLLHQWWETQERRVHRELARTTRKPIKLFYGF